VIAVILDGQRIIDKIQEIIETFDILREEIRLYNIDVYKKDYVVVINKIDLVPDSSELVKIKKVLENRSGKKVFLISAVTGKGLDKLVEDLYQRVDEYRRKIRKDEESSPDKAGKVSVYSLNDSKSGMDKIEIEKNNSEYVVKNKKIERMVAMTDLSNEEALDHLKNRLKKMGIADRLKKMGVKEGSTVIIGDLVFSLVE